MTTKTIWKFHVPIVDNLELSMPRGAEPLYVGTTNGVDVELWALVDPAQPSRPQRVAVRGTGHAVLADLRRRDYVGTVVTRNGAMVWHVFVPEEES